MKRIILLIAMMFISFPLISISLEEGNLKLVVDEDTGTFVLYGRAQRQNPWKALWEEGQDSSYLSVFYGDQWINLSSDSSVYRSFENDGLGLNIRFQEARFIVDLRLELVQVEEGELSSYVRCRGTLSLKEDEAAVTGMRYLLDTSYQQGQSHYWVDNQPISMEYDLFQNMPDYILNQGSGTLDRLYIPLADQDFGPDRVIAANWNRLDSATDPGVYSIRNGRGFDYLPYSLNDGALALYWQSTSQEALEVKRFQFSIGNRAPTEEAVTPEREEEAITSNIRRQVIEDHLDYIQELLDELDYIQQSGQTLSENDIFVLQDKLETLESKKSDYENLQ